MVTNLSNITKAPEKEAEKIAAASENEARQLVHRGIRERCLSKIVHCPNWLEKRPQTRDLARKALRRLGFPTT
jgi:hypothetical protein